jgi:hypothetical protein
MSCVLETIGFNDGQVCMADLPIENWQIACDDALVKSVSED